MRHALPIALLLIASSELKAQGSDVSKSPVPGDQVTPEYENTREGRLPGDNVVPNIDLSKAKGLQEMINKANQEFSQYADRANGIPPSGATVPQHPEPQGIEVVPSNESIPSGIKTHSSKRHPPARTVPRQQIPLPSPAPASGGDTKVFAENMRFRNALAGVETVTLPSNSYAMATLDLGVKVRLGKQMRMPVTIDYAFLGPNGAVVEMTGCNAWVTVEADPSTSRLYGSIGNMSCRAPNGQTFNIDVEAHIADQEDNYLGIAATTVLNGKGSAALAAFGQDAATAFGAAMAAAQVQTQVQTSPEGNIGVTGANVTGDQNKYIAGQTIAGASGRFLNWYVDFQMSRQPSLDVPSGKKIFLATDGELQIPKIFFGEEVDPEAVRKINTNISLMKKVASEKKG